MIIDNENVDDRTSKLDKTWAYLRLEYISDYLDKLYLSDNTINNLNNIALNTALKYKLVTPWTSMIVVDYGDDDETIEEESEDEDISSTEVPETSESSSNDNSTNIVDTDTDTDSDSNTGSNSGSTSGSNTFSDTIISDSSTYIGGWDDDGGYTDEAGDYYDAVLSLNQNKFIAMIVAIISLLFLHVL